MTANAVRERRDFSESYISAKVTLMKTTKPVPRKNARPLAVAELTVCAAPGRKSDIYSVSEAYRKWKALDTKQRANPRGFAADNQDHLYGHIWDAVAFQAATLADVLLKTDMLRSWMSGLAKYHDCREILMIESIQADLRRFAGAGRGSELAAEPTDARSPARLDIAARDLGAGRGGGT